MMVLSTRGVMFERLIVIVGKTGGKEIDMALPKDFIDTNDFTKEQILAIEESWSGNEEGPSRLTVIIRTCSATRALA